MQLYILTLLSIYAPQYDILPHVAAAVVKTESSFNPKAVGPLKEVGLFQVRPEFSKYTADELFDPEINIKEGLRILSEAKRKCKHKQDKEWLVCYNLGLYGGSKIKYPKKFRYYTKVMENMSEFI